MPRHGRVDAYALATVIISLRKQRGLSQERLAAASDVDRTYVGGIERGKRRASFQILEKLLTGMAVTGAEFGTALDREAKRR
jgi:transcriptional regulator with XRE-family HTH domain